MTGQTAEKKASRLLDALEALPTTDDLGSEIEKRLEAAQALQAKMEAARVDLREHIVKLESMRRALVKDAKRAARQTNGERTPIQRAGRGNVAKVAAMLKSKGPMTKAEVTHELGMNNGTVTYALRALEEQGQARKTGNRSTTGSDEFEFVGTARRVARPGSRS